MIINSLIIFYVVISNTIATIFLKKSSEYFVHKNTFLLNILYMDSIGWVFLVSGMFFYVTSLFLSLIAYSRMDVSFFLPFTSLTFVLAIFAGWIFFGENISILRMAGIALIVTGVAMVAGSK